MNSWHKFLAYMTIIAVTIFGLMYGVAHSEGLGDGKFPKTENRSPLDITEWNALVSDTNFIVDGHCSGTLISSVRRLVLTNFHCIDDDLTNKNEPTVWQTRTDGFEIIGKNVYQTTIVAFNKEKDVAVLQIKDPRLPTVKVPTISTSYTRGVDVWIVGNPIMLEASIVRGVVSNHNRTIGFSDGSKHDYLQFSGGIIGGNSGGSLYNQYGDIIGITAAGYANATFIGFAIPMNIVMGVLNDSCIGYAKNQIVELKKCPGGSKLKW